ncbi:uncharacterized protein F4812DRAFT_462634 [Daldinia caldariorum]|uniref:uncharacterized protein n=1 Tax=Daldinia caldariorum TaxID=326644 RepID=UPI00200731EC|nr:uncharacterized protein F4812DRAFT_462634 [Daldinia caldariorum]KAI1464574.1 hypothetical protein F4812DRAFT_462634 [Daldinia caldariorum]
MANNGRPRMPPAASAKMAMSMVMSKATTAASEMVNDTDLNSPTQEPAAVRGTNVQLDLDQRKHLEHAATSRSLASTSSLSSGSMQLKSRNREKALNMQHIQLAVQLKDQKEVRETLQTSITGLEDQLASLKLRNEALEHECKRLHDQIHDANEKLNSQAAEFEKREKDMLDGVADLESKLDEASKSILESTAGRDTLQKAYDEVVKARDQQAGIIHQLELDLEATRAQVETWKDSHEKMQEHVDELSLAASNLKELHESRERELQQRLTSKGTEIKDLKREMKKLRDDWEETVEHRQLVLSDLTSLKIQREILEKYGESQKAESQTLRQSLEELRKSTEPFAQKIAIGVDISGSLSSVIHRVKQTYRDVLHIIKSNNSDAQVAVVIHGGYVKQQTLHTQTISKETFQALNSIAAGGTEDYIYCLDEVTSLLGTNTDSKKLVILIGDGNTSCARGSSVLASCRRLKASGIRVHSIVLSNGSSWVNPEELLMRDISQATNGRVESEESYMSAVEEIVRHEREQHFNTAK